MAFFFKMFPEIIADGRLYIAEPPLYRVNDKNNPFVINNEDYNNRYANNASKEYKIGYISDNDEITFLNKKDLTQLLSDTSSYVDDIQSLSEHYKVNDRLLEFIVEELSLFEFKDTKDNDIENIIKQINSQVMMNKLNEEFPELNYNDDKHLIYGTINTVMQMIEISVPLVRKSLNLIKIIQYWNTAKSKLVLKKINTGTEYRLSLLGILKILKKYQPEKLHRFKGLGENDTEDIKQTIMDPNTRTLIRVNLGDIENDSKIFQMLRGGSSLDALNRKYMMKEYQIPRELIDT